MKNQKLSLRKDLQKQWNCPSLQIANGSYPQPLDKSMSFFGLYIYVKWIQMAYMKCVCVWRVCVCVFVCMFCVCVVVFMYRYMHYH